MERGTDQVNILPKDAIPHETVGITGDRTHDSWIINPTPYQLSHMRPLYYIIVEGEWGLTGSGGGGGGVNFVVPYPSAAPTYYFEGLRGGGGV